MSTDRAHPIELDLFEALAAQLDRGAPFSLAVALTTKAGCDLAGAQYQVLQGGEAVAAGVLPPIVRFDPTSNDYDPRNGPLDKRDHVRIALRAPSELGVFHWTLVLPEQELGGIPLAEAALTFSFRTAEHGTSLAVWDVPSPVVAGEKFSVKVGAKCTACCALGGRQVELRDETGCVLAVGHLGETVWPGTQGLYWTELEASAPDNEGLHNGTVAFAACDHALPHQGAVAALSFVTVAPGRHRVCVAIVERETGAPVAQAQVRLGYHRCASDEAGVARFTAPSGKHRLFVWKADFSAPEQVVDVEQDLDLVVEAEALPKDDPYARWQG
ncbi:MAG: hypothetical protein QOI12_2671 [Alphaproteobacteria bacterium]|jgi:hypothetical protein|nr:hypothetical protein [Alphaproteobacteria bacterium]